MVVSQAILQYEWYTVANLGVSNIVMGDPQKLLLCFVENPIKIDDLGYTHVRKPPDIVQKKTTNMFVFDKHTIW